jgi:hypothetical protein
LPFKEKKEKKKEKIRTGLSFDSRQALLIANSIELGRPPGIKRLSNPLKILVAPDSSNPADSESTNSGIFCSEGLSSNSSNLGHVDPE